MDKPGQLEGGKHSPSYRGGVTGLLGAHSPPRHPNTTNPSLEGGAALGTPGCPPRARGGSWPPTPTLGFVSPIPAWQLWAVPWAGVCSLLSLTPGWTHLSLTPDPALGRGSRDEERWEGSSPCPSRARAAHWESPGKGP